MLRPKCAVHLISGHVQYDFQLVLSVIFSTVNLTENKFDRLTVNRFQTLLFHFQCKQFLLTSNNKNSALCYLDRHWRIRGGRRQRVPPPPPTGSISFIFAYIFTKKCTCQRLALPQRVSNPPQWEILDPPLIDNRFFFKLAKLTAHCQCK